MHLKEAQYLNSMYAHLEAGANCSSCSGHVNMTKAQFCNNRVSNWIRGGSESNIFSIDNLQYTALKNGTKANVAAVRGARHLLSVTEH